MRKPAILAALLFCCVITTSAQSTDSTGDLKLNIFKLNVTALAVKNYSVQYERIFRKKLGAAISFRSMPTTSVPFKGLILDIADEDPDTKQVLDKLRLSNFAITPELRWYLGKKGYGRGIYLAAFYRYAKFKSNSVVFTYDNTFNNESTIILSGKFSSHTGGVMLGAQWQFGKNIFLDWWIFGPHYGTADGDFSGLTDHTLTPQEQNSLRSSLEDVDIPLTNKTVFVNANGAKILLDGPWAGFRAGLSLGIGF